MFHVSGLRVLSLTYWVEVPRTRGLHLALGCWCPAPFNREVLPVSLGITFDHLMVQHE